MSSSRILIVEDERLVAADLEGRLTAMGYSVAGVTASGEAALRLAAETRPDLALMDIKLASQMDGIETASHLRQQHDIAVVFLTSYSDKAVLERARLTQPLGYLVKPFDEHSLHATLEMALFRHQAETKLRKMERCLAMTLRSIGDAVIATDLQGRVNLINAMAERLTGWRRETALGQPLNEVLSLRNETTGQPLESPFTRALSEGVSIRIEEGTLLVAKDGRTLPIDETASPIRDDAGQISGVVVVFRDASDRKRAQAAARRTTNLDAVNQELAAFAYVVSHDLRAPIRAIHCFSQMLKERDSMALDAEGQQFLEVIQRNAAKQGQMIDGYLRLSKLTQCELTWSKLDMLQLVHAVLANLRAHTLSAWPAVQIHPLPAACGDEALVRQVWENLISNAVKFSRQRQQPVIVICGSEQNGLAVYQVQDNGVGFDMKYANTLFGIFQRLHSTEQFEGLGLGLAAVQRIMDRLGGRVWAASQPDHGATFFFTLPLKAPTNVAPGESGLPAQFLEAREPATVLAPSFHWVPW